MAIKQRYSLRVLLLVITVTCGVLALFYPRASYEVYVIFPELSRPANKAVDSAVLHQLLGSSNVMRRIATEYPEAAGYLDDVPGKGDYLQERISVTVVDDETLRLKITGRPTERRKIKFLLDAAAEAAVDFHNENVFELNREHGELLEKPLTEIKDAIPGAVGKVQERLLEMEKALQARVDELDRAKKKPARILERKRGIAF